MIQLESMSFGEKQEEKKEIVEEVPAEPSNIRFSYQNVPEENDAVLEESMNVNLLDNGNGQSADAVEEAAEKETEISIYLQGIYPDINSHFPVSSLPLPSHEESLSVFTDNPMRTSISSPVLTFKNESKVTKEDGKGDEEEEEEEKEAFFDYKKESDLAFGFSSENHLRSSILSELLRSQDDENMLAYISRAYNVITFSCAYSSYGNNVNPAFLFCR